MTGSSAYHVESRASKPDEYFGPAGMSCGNHHTFPTLTVTIWVSSITG
jgi:hypothetical protein